MDFWNSKESALHPGKYFEQLAWANSEFLVLLDPISYKIRFINHLPSGLPEEELNEKDIFQFVSPEHKDKYRAFLDQIATSGNSRSIEMETLPRTENNVVDRGWYSCTGYPIKNESGKTESILLVSKNTTKEKLQSMEILNKEEKLYAILNNTNDVILSIDRDYRLTEFNSVFSRMIEKGYGIKALMGTSVLDYIDPNKHHHLKAIYTKVFEGEIANDVESFETISGLKVYNETSYHPIRNFQQEITGISIFSKDITHRILNEQKLKKALKEKEVLLAEIHHRIKNNLALVSSMLQLKEITLENQDAKQALSDSRKRIRSTALVHEMLYRTDSFNHVVLHEYLTELFNNLNTNPAICLELRGATPVFDLDRALPFGLMMHELMMNSFKHSFKEKNEGRLEVEFILDKALLQVEYCDCGGDFPESVNFNDTTSTGLMLIHTLAEQLNGSIELTSRKPPRYEIKIPLKNI
jgi:PAS domain S-box-containing protein